MISIVWVSPPQPCIDLSMSKGRQPWICCQYAGGSVFEGTHWKAKGTTIFGGPPKNVLLRFLKQSCLVMAVSSRKSRSAGRSGNLHRNQSTPSGVKDSQPIDRRRMRRPCRGSSGSWWRWLCSEAGAGLGPTRGPRCLRWSNATFHFHSFQGSESF